MSKRKTSTGDLSPKKRLAHALKCLHEAADQVIVADACGDRMSIDSANQALLRAEALCGLAALDIAGAKYDARAKTTLPETNA